MRNLEGQTALSVAVYRNRLDCVKELLKYHVDVNAQDVQGNSPIIYAAFQGHLEILKELISHLVGVSGKEG